MNGALGLGCLVLTLLAHPRTHPPTHTSPSECTCKTAAVHSGWCGKCEVGYAASVPITSRTLFESLDLHGHDLDVMAVECPSCRDAVKSEGYCESHRIGFVGGHAYASRLTYAFAKGTPKDVATIKCEICRANARLYRKNPAEATGWCKTCGVGMVGNIAFKSKADFERATEAFKRLLVAVRTAERCELCAAAIVYDTRCPTCRIQYRDGKAVEPEGAKAREHQGMEGEACDEEPPAVSGSPTPTPDPRHRDSPAP